MAASVQEATAPVPLQGAEDELVAAASQLRLDDVKVARSFCKVFAARARAAEAHGARAKAFGEWRRCTERAAPAAPASTTPRKRRRTPLKALENIQPTSGGKPRSARSPRSPQPASNGKSGRRSATKSPPRGTPHPYVPPPPPPESPAVASPRRVRWSPVAPAAAPTATPEKAAVRRDLFSADENDAAPPAKADAPLALPSPAKAAPLALRPRHTPPPKTPADASPVVSPAPRVTPTEAAEQTKAREAERKELEAVLAERDGAIRGLQERLEVVTTEMESLKASAEKARSESTEYQSFLEAESETAKRDVLEAASALQELQDKYDWVSKEHQDLQNQLDQRLEQELEQSEARSTEAAEQAKAREAERKELEAVLAERDGAIRGLQERLEVVMTIVSEKGAELERLEATLQNRIREQEQYASFLESEIEVKTQDVMNAVHALEELQSKLDFVSEEAENEIHRHQEERETREDERIEMLQRLSTSNEQIAHLQAALEQSEQLHQSVASQMVSDTTVFEQTHAARQSEIRNLEVKLSDAEAKFSCQTDLGTCDNLDSVVPAFHADSAMPLSDRDVAKFKAREKEQAEYASLLEQELAESQASAAQAGNALSVAEQHIARLQAEIQEIQGVHHDSISQTKTARRASDSELEKVQEENVGKIPRPSSGDLLHSSVDSCEGMSGGHNHQQNASMATLAPATIAQRDLKDNKRKDLGANKSSSSVSRLVPTPSLPVINVEDDLVNAVDTSNNVSQRMSFKMPHSFVGLLILPAVLLVLAVASGSLWPSYLLQSAHKTLGNSTPLEKTQCGNQLQDLRKEYTKLAQQEAACQVNASQCAKKFQGAHECKTKLGECQKQSERQSLQTSDLQSEIRSLHTQLFDKHADIETLRGEIVSVNQKAEMHCKRKLADSLLACDEAKATRRPGEQLKRGPVGHDTNATTCRGYFCSSESNADSQGRWFARRPKVAHRLTREENARIFTAFF